MKDKDLMWKVTVEGEEYTVRCEPMKSLFDVYVDEELTVRVPRKMKHDDEDSEYDLRIGGKRCQFVLYDGKPDLCVDGILLGAQREIDQKERRDKLLLFFGGIFVTLVSSFAVFLWYAFEVSGDPIFGGKLSLVFILIFVGLGVWMVLRSLKRKKTY